MAFVVLSAATAHAQCKYQRVASANLELQGDRAIVALSMNEHPGKFEVDTGSGITLLDPAFAAASHVGMDKNANQMTMTGAGGRQTLPVWMAHVRRTDFGELSFPDWEYLVASQPIFPSGHIDGLLGTDFLHYFDLELDFPAGKMILWRLLGCTTFEPPWTGVHDAIELKATKGAALSMPIWIDNAFLDVMLDTGAGGLLLTRGAANHAGASDDQLARDRALQGAGIGGGFSVTLHTFKTLLIGNGEFNAPTIGVDANPDRGNGDVYAGRDGILGLGFFKADKIWISYATRTLFLQTPEQAKTKPK